MIGTIKIFLKTVLIFKYEFIWYHANACMCGKYALYDRVFFFFCYSLGRFVSLCHKREFALTHRFPRYLSSFAKDSGQSTVKMYIYFNFEREPYIRANYSSKPANKSSIACIWSGLFKFSLIWKMLPELTLNTPTRCHAWDLWPKSASSAAASAEVPGNGSSINPYKMLFSPTSLSPFSLLFLLSIVVACRVKFSCSLDSWRN